MSKNTIDPVTAALIGSLVGSLMTFALGMLASFLKSLREGKRDNHNALIKLERLLLEHTSIANSNRYLVPPFTSTISSGNVYWSKLSTFPIDKTIDLKLQNIDLVNKVFYYNDSISKINHDIDTLQFAYEKLEAAFISGNIEPNTYIINAKNLSKQLKAVDIFLKDLLENEIIEIAAEVRLHVNDSSNKFSQKTRRFFLKSKSPEKDKIQKETTKIKAEVEENRKNNKDKIQEIEKQIKKIT